MNSNYCSITGECHCKCLYERNKSSALKVDLKSALRKLFTDHAVYMVFLLKGIVDLTSDTQVFLTRLLRNQVDIGDQLKPIIGTDNGNKVTAVLTKHIKLAGSVITAETENDRNLNLIIQDLFTNSADVAQVLSSLNPQLLPYAATKQMFDIHNQFVIDMTVARINGDFNREQQLYDGYYNEILAMSDAIYYAL